MTLSKFVVRGKKTQGEQKSESAKMTPKGVKHVDLLSNRFLEINKAPKTSTPQKSGACSGCGKSKCSCGAE